MSLKNDAKKLIKDAVNIAVKEVARGSAKEVVSELRCKIKDIKKNREAARKRVQKQASNTDSSSSKASYTNMVTQNVVDASIDARLLDLRNDIAVSIDKATSVKDIDMLRKNLFGKKGKFTNIVGTIGALPPEERCVVATYANEVRSEIMSMLSDRRKVIDDSTVLVGEINE